MHRRELRWPAIVAILVALGLYLVLPSSLLIGPRWVLPLLEVALIIPVLITAYADRSFTFITKTPPAAILLKKAAKIESGSGEPNKTKVGKVSQKQIREIAEQKLPDLNTTSVESAMRSVAGTARSMGLDVVD